MNYNIQSVKSRIYQIFCDLGLAAKPITAQIIKDIYLGNHKNEEDGKTLVEVHSDHNERCRQLLNIEYAQSTIYKFDASLKYLKEFMDKEFLLEDYNVNIKTMKLVVEDAVRIYNNKRPHWSCLMKTPEQMHEQKIIKIKTYKKPNSSMASFATV